MSLKEKIAGDVTEAMKKGDKNKKETLRMILSTIKNTEIETKKELTDEQVHSIIQREIKQTTESLEAFEKTGVHEAKVEELKNRIKLLYTYLPKQMNEQEIAELVTTLMKELSITEKGQKGQLMGALMPKVKGKADGKLVNQVVGKLL